MSVTAAAEKRGKNERPPISGEATIVVEHKPRHIYGIEMKNGHTAYAVAPKGLEESYAVGTRVSVEYSPYDMTRCRIIEALS